MRSGALRIALIYIALGILWITLSDEVLAMFRSQLTVNTFHVIGSTKGVFYILVTGLLLWKLIKNDNERSAEREKQYREMYEGNPIPMWIYDIDTLRFVSVNQTAVESYGYTKDVFLSMTILDIRPEADREKVRERVPKVTDSVKNSGSWVHKKADGTLIYVSISSQKMLFDNKEHIMVIAQDINDHIVFEQRLKKLNNDLREKQRKLSETQQIAKVAGWEFYLQGREMVWSEEMYLLTNTLPNDMEDTYERYGALIHPEDRARVDKAFDHAVRTGEELDIIHRITNGKEDTCYVRQQARLENMLDIPFKMIGTMQDITESKLLELERDQYQHDLEYTLNTISEGFFMLDSNSMITKVNLKFVEETGLSREDIIGKTLTEVFPDVKDHSFCARFDKILKDRAIVRFEDHSEALKKWISVSSYPTEEGLAVYFQDITEKKEKDIQLKHALERYNIVSKATNDVIYDLDIANDHIIYNTSISQLVNCDLNEIYHNLQWWRSLIHPDDLPEVISGQKKVLDNKETNWWCEYRVDRGDHEYKYVYDQGYFMYDEEERPIRLIGAIKDIDALKRTDEENKRLAEIITKVNNMVVVMDDRNQITWVNKAFEDYTHYRSENVIGQYTFDVLKSLHVSDEVLEVIAQGKRGLEAFSIQVPHHLPHNGHQWLEIEYTPLFNKNHKHKGYIAVYQNITQRKIKEAQVNQQNKTLQEIAWLSSHEVRRPVASILGLIYLAKETNSMEEMDEIIEMINHCAEELDSIVHVISQRVNEEAETANAQDLQANSSFIGSGAKRRL